MSYYKMNIIYLQGKKLYEGRPKSNEEYEEIVVETWNFWKCI